jgi:hypothetical protein
LIFCITLFGLRSQTTPYCFMPYCLIPYLFLRLEIVFVKKLFFLLFLNYFDILILKIIFLKKIYHILICFFLKIKIYIFAGVESEFSFWHLLCNFNFLRGQNFNWGKVVKILKASWNSVQYVVLNKSCFGFIPCVEIWILYLLFINHCWSALNIFESAAFVLFL